MKRLIIILALLVASPAWAGGKKKRIAALEAQMAAMEQQIAHLAAGSGRVSTRGASPATGLGAITPTTDDLLYVVDDPGGTPASKKTTVAGLKTGMGGDWLELDAGNSPVTGALEIDVDASPVLKLTRADAVNLHLESERTDAGPLGSIRWRFPNASAAVVNAGSLRYTTTNRTAGAEAAYFSLFTRNGGASAERLRVTEAGDVGIGVTAPDSTLEVESADDDTARFTGTSGGQHYIMNCNATICWSSGQDAAEEYFTGRTGTSGAKALRVDSTIANDALYVDGNGNVSVGTVADTTDQYLTGDAESGAPPSADCDADAERNRQILDYTNHRLYICNGATRGWDYVTLTD